MECFLCGSEIDLEVHHVDWHHENDLVSNRLTLCHRCHVAVHRVGFLNRQELEWVREQVHEQDPGRFLSKWFVG